MNKPGVLWGANWERTETFFAIGQMLEPLGYRNFYALTRKEYVDQALALGIPRERILWLRRQAALRFHPSAELLARMQAVEAVTGVNLKNLELMDRHQRWREKTERFQYFAYVFQELEDFLRSNEISFMLGQPDTVHDLIGYALILATRISAGANLSTGYGSLFASRIRGAELSHLWDGLTEEKLWELPESEQQSDVALAQATVRDIVQAGAPRVSHVRQRTFRDLLPMQIARMLHRALVVSRDDAAMYNIRGLITDLKYHLVPLNRILIRLLKGRLFSPRKSEQPYVLFALHLAPEHTVDVEAPLYGNVDEMVAAIARSLPFGIELWIKEHPVAVGIHSPATLMRWQRIPGVRLLSASEKTPDLIAGALLTISLSGTVALEAALMGRRAVIFADVFMSRLSLVSRLKHPSEITALFKQPLEQNQTRDIEVVDWLLRNAIPGSALETITDPLVLQPENIRRLADGIKRRLDAVEAHPFRGV